MLGAMETELTAGVVAAVATAAFLVGLAKGGLPGVGAVITVVVALAVPATVAIGIVLPLLMVGDVVALWALRGHVDTAVLRTVVPGAGVGVALASFFLRSLSPGALELAIVVIVVVFAAYRGAVLAGRLPTPPPDSALATPTAGGAAGFAAGITSTVAHAGGPPVAIHLLTRQLAPLRYAGTSAAIFWAVNWMKVPGYAAAGLFDGSLLLRLAPTAVLIVPGVLAGRWAARRLDARRFEILVLVGLLAGAALLIVR